jgi:peptide-methionine (R)-S-oxide reductase
MHCFRILNFKKAMRQILVLLLWTIAISCNGQQKGAPSKAAKNSDGQSASYTVQKTDTEWRSELSEMAYFVLRKSGTEPPNSSDLLHVKSKGTFVCAGCGTPLFESDYKYDSGSGWPSFDREKKGNVAYSIDTSYGMQRVEEHCAVCGGHLGHVFDDGPRKTTGKRHCINGAALKFIPAQ